MAKEPAKASLFSRIQSSGTIKTAQILSESFLFNDKDVIPSEIPIINLAFSGLIDGGFTTGLTILSGESKTFKTLLSLFCLKTYFNTYPDSYCLLYDSEFGTTPGYLKALGLDTSRIIHIPIEHVEQLKFDIVKRLNSIERGDKIFILVDSLGNLASKKEVEDAGDEKSVADMSRAKSIRSLLRIITPHLATKDLPCIMVNHVYKEMASQYPKDIIPGGTAVTYAANQIFVITKAQEKEGDEIIGSKFTININKSRFVKEKSKFPFTVLHKKGIMKWSGMFEFALEGHFIVQSKLGWYQLTDLDTGEIFTDKSYRAKDIATNNEIWERIIKHQRFKDYLMNRFRLSEDSLFGDNAPSLTEDGDDGGIGEISEE